MKFRSRSNYDSDIEDLIESQPVDKTMHEWEQSTIEAEHIIKTLTVECQIVLDPFMGYGIVALKLDRKFIGIETDKEHYSRADSKIIRHPLNLEFKIFSLFALKYPYFL